MPIKYVATLGAVAGIVQVVNQVEITCGGRPSKTITAGGRPSVSITVNPTLTPSYGGA